MAELHPSIVALVALAANIAVVQGGSCCTPTASGQSCC